MESPYRQPGAEVGALGTLLRAHGYRADALMDIVPAARRVEALRLQRTVARLEAAERCDPLAALARLFWLDAAEDRDRLAREVPGLDVEALTAAGLMAVEGDRVRSEVRIEEVFGLLVASDAAHERDDWVVGAGESTRTAAFHTPRVAARSALDMGCGQGLHALLAARHCERVVATDANPRALWMTDLNARLNAVGNVETREGSFLEPVAGGRFDLVVVNPPYVISPAARFSYRDGGLEGDELSRMLLGGLPGLLVEGGFGVLQGNWVHRRDERWHAPVERILGGSGCDALVARMVTLSPFEYAATWNEHHHAHDPDGFARSVGEWVEHFAGLGIDRVSIAMVVLRRRTGALNWRRSTALAGRPEAPDGEALAALFAAQDRLADLDDDALLNVPLRAPAKLRIERRAQLGGEDRCVLQLDSAFGVRRPVPPRLGDLVMALETPRRLRDIEGAEEEIDPVRTLLKLGFLTFA